MPPNETDTKTEKAHLIWMTKLTTGDHRYKLIITIHGHYFNNSQLQLPQLITVHET
jgi:hypothetical protein